MRLTARLPIRPVIGGLAMQFGLAFALAMAVAAGIAFVAARHQLGVNLDDALTHERDKLIAPGERPASGLVLQRIGQRMARKAIWNRGHVLFGPDGRRLYGTIEMAAPPAGLSAVRFRDGSPKWHEGRALGVALADGGRLVIVAHSEIDETMREMLITGFAALVIAAGLAGLGATWVLERAIARRLARTLDTAAAIAGGDLSRRIATAGLDGLFARQAASLNHMLDRMEQMMRSQRQFASHLAHDLRTPLTRLRALLTDEAAAPQPLRERAERECRQIIATFDALLRLSEIEAGRHPAALAPLALAPVIEDVAETMEPVIADAGSQLATGPLAPLSIIADQGLLQQLLINLIDNIALHTPPGTRARVSLRREGGEAVVTVADNGPGLGEAERGRVVRPFERGAGGHPAGSGLGLAIAEAIMRFHGGQLELADNAPGLAVRLRFPAEG